MEGSYHARRGEASSLSLPSNEAAAPCFVELSTSSSMFTIRISIPIRSRMSDSGIVSLAFYEREQSR
ncbi:MAG: hypothetical protein COB10_03620 [Planctomycetota bacterium]|nr:MAG: hypothetical protein COB10_03620 [Planctomycetota bacterium]